jgi:nitrate reductase NapD
MSICSVVVHTKPEATLKASATIETMPHCEVMGAEGGRVVVVIDVRNRKVMSDTIMALNDVDGVINVSLVYEYFEPDDELGVPEPAAESAPLANGGSCGA